MPFTMPPPKYFWMPSLVVGAALFSNSARNWRPKSRSRTIGLDFSYRLPHVRHWLTLYAEGLVPESNPFNVDMSKNPIYFPARTAVRSGMYIPRLPRLPKLDFRVEAVYTDPPTPRSRSGDYVYWDAFY